MKYITTSLLLSGILSFILHETPNIHSLSKLESNFRYSKVNSVIDRYNGVDIYFNGSMTNTHGRHLTKDGYNLGLKWQCVEFVKRYYYLKHNHKMPNSYGHAKDFFDKKVKSGWNSQRGMNQLKNGTKHKPKVDMILVFDKNDENPFGHIAIVSKVEKESITIAQQNWGTHTRMQIPLLLVNGKYFVDHPDVLGYLFL